MRTSLLTCIVLAMLAACSSGTSSLVPEDDVVDVVTPPEDLVPEVASPDVGPQFDQVDPVDLALPEDLAQDLIPDFAIPQCQPGDGCFLDKCTENSQCESGWCVEHMGEGVCSQMCQEECPEGWTCKQVAGADPDVVFVCASNVANLCKPCNGTDDCKSVGGVDDVCVDYGPAGAFCGSGCGIEQPCPWGFTCQPSTTVDGLETTQCVADAGVCPCTEKSVALSLWTACEYINTAGTCTGMRVCTEAGLLDCDAPAATLETCNGLDDDCDGEVDEPELSDGDYVNLCFDGADCTEDICAGEEGCLNKPLEEGTCDDANPCTVADHCEAGVCVGDLVQCDDENPCTQDLCTATGGCDHPPQAGPCDDGDPCTLGDQCAESQCGGTPVACDCVEDADCQQLEDGDLCNGTLVCDLQQVPHKCVVAEDTVIQCDAPQGVDAPCLATMCDAETGQCLQVAANDGAPCDDTDPCSLADICEDGLCSPGTAVNCNDGNPCTGDTCEVDVGCVYEELDIPCDDGDVCTTADVCSQGECVSGQPLVCDDGNVCTDDSCGTGVGCTHLANEAACDDGDLCTVGDHCAGAQCVHTGPEDCDDGNPCTIDTCTPDAGCQYKPGTGPCDDNDPCTVNDVCFDGGCQPGEKVVCDDGNACTDDSCGQDGKCLFVDNESTCDDGNICTTGDHCEMGLCVHTMVDTCGDDNPCTDTWCDPVQGCVVENNAGACDDGDECTLGDVCADGQCGGTETLPCDDNNLCTDDQCVPGQGCVFAPNDATCDDGNQCTENDQCGGGWCTGGAMKVCDDQNLCTDDSCDADLGCVYTANTNPCDDGNFCTVGDSCDQTVCVAGADVPCNDGQFCNGDESCDPDSGCVAGVPPVLDDLVACTADVCDENTDQVLHTPDHEVCPEGGLCQHGVCDPDSGCLLETTLDCCGNTLPEDPEECDDGNTENDDDCIACANAFCGDGFVHKDDEQCEAGLLGDATCEGLVGPGYTGNLGCDGDCNYDTSDCTGPLGSQTNPAPTCEAILDAGKSIGNGVYYLLYNDTGIQAWCDMDNGGWTLITSWQYQPTPGPWGEFHTAVELPEPGKHHHLPFKALFPLPDRVKMTYLGNNQSLEFDIKDAQTWSTASNGTRVQVDTGNYLIFENLHCSPGQGVCVVNGNYHDHHNCDGDSGQISGQGWFNHCTGNEFSNCGTYGWKYSAGGNSATVCSPTAQLAVYLK